MDTQPRQPGPDLSALLASAAEGDEAAWKAIVKAYARRVFGLARSRVRSPELAEEITQSVFVTIASKLKSGGYTEQGRFEPWLFRVAVNRIRDEVRRSRRQAAPTDPEQLDEARAAPDHAGVGGGRTDPASLDRLRLALSRLSETDREIIELRHHAGLSFNQMVEMLGEPLGTLLARHHRALKKLKDMLSAEIPTAETEGAA